MPNRYKASSFNGAGSAFDGNLYHMEQQHQPVYEHHHHFQPQAFAPPPPPPGFPAYRASEPHFVVQPRLARASTLAQAQNQQGQRQSQFDARVLNEKVTLSFRGEIGSMTSNWTEQERQSSRRLVLISWTQEYSHLTLSFRPIPHKDYIPGMPVLSCIYWEDTDKYYATSVDLITLLEHLVHARFPVEEKNRIRRNLQSLKPLTITKGNERFHSFFQLIMQYDCPKPRHIEKDVKVLYWSAIEDALCKVLSKYTVDPYIEPSNGMPTHHAIPPPPQQQHQQQHQQLQQQQPPPPQQQQQHQQLQQPTMGLQGPPQGPPQQQQQQQHMGMNDQYYTHEPQFPPQHMPQYFTHDPAGHPQQSLPPTQSFGGAYFSGHYSAGASSTAGSSQYHQNSIVDPLTPAHSSNSSSMTPTLQPTVMKTESQGYPQMSYATSTYQHDGGANAPEMP